MFLVVVGDHEGVLGRMAQGRGSLWFGYLWSIFIELGQAKSKVERKRERERPRPWSQLKLTIIVTAIMKQQQQGYPFRAPTVHLLCPRPQIPL